MASALLNITYFYTINLFFHYNFTKRAWNNVSRCDWQRTSFLNVCQPLSRFPPVWIHQVRLVCVEYPSVNLQPFYSTVKLFFYPLEYISNSITWWNYWFKTTEQYLCNDPAEHWMQFFSKAVVWLLTVAHGNKRLTQWFHTAFICICETCQLDWLPL